MAMDLKYEDEQLNLDKIIQFRSLPEVVRICNTEYEIPVRLRSRNYFRIEPDTEVMLQKTQKVKYAHIKILKDLDNDTSQEEKEAEYVPEHEAYVGDEFLIPSQYRGKVKFVHRPGGYRRYATVSQVLNDLPSSVKIEEDTECLLANDLQKKMHICAHTTIKLRRKFQNPRDGSTYLECTDNYGNSYAFHQDDRINFTEVEDPKFYHLFELVRCQMLPKVIRFEKVPSEDAILADTPLNSAMLSSTKGPIELLGFKEVEVLVSWIRDTEKRVFGTVLIPKAAWNTVLVQKRKFLKMDSKKDYIEKQFDECIESDFIEKCMYLMSPDLSLVTWLRHPNRFSESKDNEVVDHVSVHFPDKPVSTSPRSSNRYSVWKNIHLGQKIFRKNPIDLIRHKIKIPTSKNVHKPAFTKHAVSERKTCETADVPKQTTHANPVEKMPKNQAKCHNFVSPSLSEDIASTYTGQLQYLEEAKDKVSEPESSHDYDYIDDDKISDIHQVNSYAMKQRESAEVTSPFSSSSMSADNTTADSSQTYGLEEYERMGSNHDLLQIYAKITDFSEAGFNGNNAQEMKELSKPSDLQAYLSTDETNSGKSKDLEGDEEVLSKSASLRDKDGNE